MWERIDIGEVGKLQESLPPDAARSLVIRHANRRR
jgi:hypothetical protein